MRILTFVPGVVNGRLPVVVDLGASPPPAELLLNGAPACRVTAVRETCVVDLGPARPGSHSSSSCGATPASGPCTLQFSWSHENALAPGELTVTIDGTRP